MKPNTVPFNKVKIMDSAFFISTTDSLPHLLVNDDLRFQGVLLTLARVLSVHCFWARLVGCSTTLTTVIINCCLFPLDT